VGLNICLVCGCLCVTVPVVGQAPQTMAVGQQQPDPSTLVYVALSPLTSARTHLLHLLLPGGGGGRGGGVGEKGRRKFWERDPTRHADCG